MHKTIDERVRMVADYIVSNNATVRQAGQYYGISKSTVHSDMTTRLERLDSVVYIKVRKILEFNMSERHLRGGYATQTKYREQVASQREHSQSDVVGE